MCFLDIRVSQIVETMVFKASLLKNLLQCFPYGWLGEVATIWMCEDQIRKASVIPGRADRQSLTGLSLFVFSQHIHHKWSRRQYSPFSILRGSIFEWSPLPAWLKQLLGYPDQAIFKINTIPRQSKQFT